MLSVLRARFLALRAFGHDGGTESAAKVFGKGIELGITIDFNRLAGGVTDDIAVVAPSQVIFEIRLSAVVESAVEVISQFLKEFGALHWLPSPLARFWKYRLSLSRNWRRARSSRDFTAGILNSKACAVSSVDSPSTSRSTNTVRNPGGSPWIVRVRMSRNSAWLYICSG